MMNRRELFMTGAAMPLAGQTGEQKVARKGRIRQGVTRGCFGRGMAFEDMCRHAARLGAQCFDLVGPADWPTVKKYGLMPNMVPGGGKLTDACNNKDLHAAIEQQFKENIPRAAAEGITTVITFSGNRRGMPDEQAWDNCYQILKKVTPLAEDKGVTICMELLNSKVNHPDYQCDKTAWGVELCKRVNSPRFKLLYDIYHMQIMEGDIIRTIKQNIQHIGHFHTAGNPGRHEPDETQELNYVPIVQAILDTGYKGYVTHEYSPVKDALTSLDKTLALCDI